MYTYLVIITRILHTRLFLYYPNQSSVPVVPVLLQILQFTPCNFNVILKQYNITSKTKSPNSSRYGVIFLYVYVKNPYFSQFVFTFLENSNFHNFEIIILVYNIFVIISFFISHGNPYFRFYTM